MYGVFYLVNLKFTSHLVRIIEEMSEQQIITLIKNGEHEAYRQLVERYQVGLIIHCDRLVRDRDVAEDIAQEAFVRAFYTINKFDQSKGSFSTWLYTIATNKAKDHQRKSRRTLPLPEHDIVSTVAVLSESELSEIRRAVDTLEPPEYATAVCAYYWEGKRYETIARELGVPVGTVGTWIKRAKTKLRKELA